jgi:hypothetical protein
MIRLKSSRGCHCGDIRNPLGCWTVSIYYILPYIHWANRATRWRSKTWREPRIWIGTYLSYLKRVLGKSFVLKAHTSTYQLQKISLKMS